MAAGVVFAAIVVLWAAYFVPLALRRYDEAARHGAVGHLSSRARVVHRTREEDAPEASEVRIDRPAARLAARRRRRTLLVLLATLTTVVVLALLGRLPVWSIAVPSALVVAWLVACRVQVRGELGLATPHLPLRSREPDEFALAHERHLDEDATDRERDALRVGDDEETVVLSGQLVDHDPHRVHVMEDAPLDVADLEEVVVDAVPVTATTGMTLWDPLPVTLPTYVDKPRAARTVRTIDFGEPGAWTSGHTGETGPAVAPRASSREADERRRAVGD